MLVAAAVCPHPPALVPAVSRGAADVLDDVRAACVDAARRLRDVQPDLLICVGMGDETRRWGPEAGGSLRVYGVDVRFGGARDGLPLALTIAAYLLEESRDTGGDVYQAVARATAPEGCRAVGADLAGLAERVALLAMADGSARRTRQSPGPYDERAEPFDAGVTRALTVPDPQALLAIEPGIAEELWVGGRPAWQVLAGALLASPAHWTADSAVASAPLGVGYDVVRLRAG